MLSRSVRRSFVALFSMTCIASAVNAATVDLPRFPSISPDGSRVCFTWRGDLWTASTTGGLALRLTTHTHDDLQSAFSPDGKKIAFSSSRAGGNNLFTVNTDGSELKQVTFGDRPLALSQWGMDAAGKPLLYFTGRIDPDPFAVFRPYTVPVEGGDITRINDALGSYPVASPDGTKVLFGRGTTGWNRRGYRGSDNRDVWLYERAANKFTKLTQHDGNDGKARWAGSDGFVFLSDRPATAGMKGSTLNLFRNNIGTADTDAKPLTTFTDHDIDDFDVTSDGKTVVFSRWNHLYTLDLSKPGATPVELMLTAADDEADRYRFQDLSRAASEAALSPDGKAMAVIVYGELYVKATEGKLPARRVSMAAGRKRNPAWSPDGSRLYYASDETGTDAIYVATVKAVRSELKKKPTTTPSTHPTSQPAEEPEPFGAAGKSTTDELVAGDLAAPVDSDVVADQARPRRGGGGAGGAPLTPGAAGTGLATRAAAAVAETSRWGEAINFTVRRVIGTPAGERDPQVSPDGRYLTFRQGLGKLVVMDAQTHTTRTLVDGWSDALSWKFSPNSRYIAYVTEDINNNADICLTPVDGSAAPVNISQHPDNDGGMCFSADGKILAFLSNRQGAETQVYAVNLDKELDAFNALEADAYFKDAAAAVKKRTPPAANKHKPTSRPTPPTPPTATTASTEPATTEPAATEPATTEPATTEPSTDVKATDYKPADLADAWQRVRKVTSMPGGVSGLVLSPAGDKYFFGASAGGTRATFSLGREGGEPTRLAADVGLLEPTLSGDAITVIDAGRAGQMKLPAGDLEYTDIAERLKIDLTALNKQKFLEATRILGQQYYDPAMGGTDWPALTRMYFPLAASVRTAEEFDFVANKLVGELNGSHLGISSPPAAPNPLAQPQGRLGTMTKHAASESGYEVLSVLPDSPADRAASKLLVGDIITTVDGEPADPVRPLESLLAGKADREVLLSLKRAGKGLELLITPTSAEAIAGIAYNNFRLAMLKKVEALSGGRLGYIHIQGMSQASLEVYKRDLYAACHGKSGMIIDVRYNGGGSTADLLLASIMVTPHAYTTPRGADPSVHTGYPDDRLYIPRYSGPINMLCNERSFSNAEIISHAFKTLKRGTLVGNTTAGGVISTGAATLVDGTSVRTPGRGWFTPDGVNMELHGAVPDILVLQMPEEEAAGSDAQLEAAVADLLKRAK